MDRALQTMWYHVFVAVCVLITLVVLSSLTVYHMRKQGGVQVHAAERRLVIVTTLQATFVFVPLMIQLVIAVLATLGMYNSLYAILVSAWILVMMTNVTISPLILLFISSQSRRMFFLFLRGEKYSQKIEITPAKQQQNK